MLFIYVYKGINWYIYKTCTYLNCFHLYFTETAIIINMGTSQKGRIDTNCRLHCCECILQFLFISCDFKMVQSRWKRSRDAYLFLFNCVSYCKTNGHILHKIAIFPDILLNTCWWCHIFFKWHNDTLRLRLRLRNEKYFNLI